MGTTLIKAKITDQTLEFTLKPMVASGGVNEDVIEFEFDALWDGFDTVAVFYRSKRNVEMTAEEIAEMEAMQANTPAPSPTPEDRLDTLEGTTDDIVLMMADLIGGGE